MAEKTISQKLGIKPGHTLLVINAPEGYAERILPPEGVTTEPNGTPHDFVQVFVKSTADVERLGATAMQAAKPGGLLWFTYPKKTGAIKTDITRDTGWGVVAEAGYRPVAQVAIDDTWSALRFRPLSEVKTGFDLEWRDNRWHKVT